jgi:uncharacterized membrane protein YphA (DoxX/SURF4 family)
MLTEYLSSAQMAVVTWWRPELSAGAQVFVRTAYGVLLLATLLSALPHGRRFFLSERWGGYAESDPWRDLLHSSAAYPVVMATWALCAVLLIIGRVTVPAALVNAVLCRHYFIRMRWKGVLRGMGAPGFMTYWLGVAVLLIEGTARYAPSARPIALLALQLDLALIFLSAGLYKVTAGFVHNDGMELGLANPAWGYWWQRYKALPPSHGLLWALNQLGWSTEVAAALLCVVPATRTLGGLLLIGSFFFIATQIRLAFLCEMVMTSAVLYFVPGGGPDRIVSSIIASVGRGASAVRSTQDSVPALAGIIIAVLFTYVVLLPIVHAGLYYNFYARRRLPGVLQGWLERYTNLFGIIIWRVFTADLVNFFIRIHREHRESGDRELMSRYGLSGGLRFSHVGESITVTCVFTTLKYYPSNPALFEQRLLRYARTLPCDRDHVLVFEYVSVVKTASCFEFIPAAEYAVDLRDGSVRRTVLRDGLSVHAPHAGSPLHEGAVPGSYAPLQPADAAAGGRHGVR